MAQQPSGTVTFLFSDLEGSTKLWEHYPEAMRAAVAAHDRLLQNAIAGNGGYIFKTVGDAFCAAFSSAAEAVAAAIASQRALAAYAWEQTGPLRARIALHTGEAEERDGDYFGQNVNRVARLLAIGYGTQILVSQTTADRLLGVQSPGYQLKDLGEHRLKDLARPERVFQLNAPGLPTNFAKLKSQPSAIAGAVGAVGASLVGLLSYQVEARSAEEGVGIRLLSPLALFTGLKGLVIELSTYNADLLLGLAAALLLLGIGFGWLRLRRDRDERELKPVTPNPFIDMLANQRTVAFLAVSALIVFGAWGYQQYLWRVALPIPSGSVGIALTRDAAAASFDDQLQDALYSQGTSKQVVIRQLPVGFNASDTAAARKMGNRIGAEAVIIYREDPHPVDANHRYIAYLVFTDPRVGLYLGSTPSDDGSAQSLPVTIKSGVESPVLQTGSLTELVDSAAGILAYNDDRLRDAISYLEDATANQTDSADTGTVGFYLGSAYSLDNQTSKAQTTLESAAAYFEKEQQSGTKLGPQDELLLVMTYTQLGRLAAGQDDWDSALGWYQKTVNYRDDLVARASGLDRPSDVHAAYAQVYSLMSDAYRAQGSTDDEQYWSTRAEQELVSLTTEASPTDPNPWIQQGVGQFFAGNCQAATVSLSHALMIDSENVSASIDQGVIYLLENRPDLAEASWHTALDRHPDDVETRKMLAYLIIDQALSGQGVSVGDLDAARDNLRQIIQIDPTNAEAYEEIADADSLIARSSLLDTAALIQGDQLTLEKSQVLWPADPAHRQAALDAIADLIEVRRNLASELKPGDPGAAADVAAAYEQQQDVLYSGLLAKFTAPAPTATPTVDTQAGAQILDDAAQIATWSNKVISDPSADRLSTLNAWSSLVLSNERVWGWYTFFAPDSAKAADALTAYRTSVKSAVAFASAAPIDSADDVAPARSIYVAAEFLAAAIDQDSSAATKWQQSIVDLTTQETNLRTQSIEHVDSTCRDVAALDAGATAAAANDPGNAVAAYATAIALNPANSGALLGEASILYLQGDSAGALAKAQSATAADPTNAAGWAAVGLYSFATGDAAGSAAAYDHFAQAVAAESVTARIADIQTALTALSTSAEATSEKPDDVAPVLKSFAGAIAAFSPDIDSQLQYAGVYAQLGRSALMIGDPADAETWLRQALKLDPHEPIAWTDLVIATMAQHENPASEIAGALAEIQAPLWASTTDYQTPALVTLMDQELTALSPRYKDQASAIDAFRAQLQSAAK